MSAQYRLDIKTANGVKVAEITEYQSLRYVKLRNAPGELVFTLDDANPKIALLEDDAQIEVWRRNRSRGLDWYCDFYALYRGTERVTNKVGVFTANCPGQLAKIGDRIVAYARDSVNRSYFSAKEAETILNTLAKYNLTASGSIADSRIRDATMAGVSVEADQLRGPLVVEWECSEQNLLQTMQELAEQYKVAFDLVKTGANTWQFRYIENTDVSDTQIFAKERGNVSEITYRKNRLSEGTLAIAGGKDKDDATAYRVVTGANYSAGNNREIYVNAGSENTDAGIDYLAQKELSAQEAKDEIIFSVLQTPSSYYGLHYNLHYLVTGRYRGVDYPLVVSQVAVDFSTGAESIDVTVKDV